MFCKNCGQTMDDNALVCPNCNTPVGADAQPAQPVQQPPYGAAQPPYGAAQPPYGAPQQPYNQQPYAPGYSNMMPPPPKPSMAWLIVNIVLMVLSGFTGLFSIIGTIFGALAQSSYNKGNYADAESKNKTCKILGIIGIVGFALLFIFCIIVFAIGGAAALADMGYYA